MRRGPSPRIAIVGAGASGLAMGAYFVKASITSFTIFERASALGGTWRDNTYPGAGCDVPAHLYCFSFEPKRDWTTAYAEQPEILAYLRDCAEKYGLLSKIRFDTEVHAARFDEAARRWHVETSAGEETFDVVIAACGQLSRPFTPDLPGLDRFEGVAFHSARWRHDQDLTGKRVAVIGNGASALQIVSRIASGVRHLSVFQRSAQWVIPRPRFGYSVALRKWFRRVPIAASVYRALLYFALEVRFVNFVMNERLGFLFEAVAKRALEEVKDPELRRRLTPDYPIGCKRVLISDEYYAVLQEPNVEVIDAPIERVTPKGIVTQDGRQRPFDAIVFATGFHTTEFLGPMRIVGASGRSLTDVWRSGARAYLGMLVPDFPNLFILYGPNTNLGHNSVLFMIECQARYVVGCLERLIDGRWPVVEVSADALEAFDARVQKRASRSVWAAPCRSWYKTADGRITNNWPMFTFQYWWRTRRPDPGDFRL